ncbi:ABC transporter ATPase [Olivibacter sitiensis]|uniref:ABC transporter ATPase n=1 Tax=Olivibacter sitiensis TaxID=376470 RepID=UPI000486CD9C|nr:ABC transporter ATPase [Olivibacter sitiensis]
MERVWIYQADRVLDARESDSVLNALTDFASQWKVHGKPLAARAELRYNLFAILMIDESVAMASGCSIDKSVHLMKELGQELGIDFFDRMRIAYRNGSTIKVVSRDQFEDKISNGEITADTIVFNNLVKNAAELQDEWEVPFQRSWHAKVFQLA